MDIHNAVKFIKCVVSKNNPANDQFLTIDAGFIFGQNAHISAGCAVDFSINCRPHAQSFCTAVEKFGPGLTIAQQENGKLLIKHKRARSTVECSAAAHTVVFPAGHAQALPDPQTLMTTLRLLRPFAGDDPKRPWATGVFFDGALAVTTNNVCLVTGAAQFPGCLVNRHFVDAILTHDEIPSRVSIGAGTVTVYYDSGAWICGRLIDAEFPNLSQFKFSETGDPVPAEMWATLKYCKAFLGDSDAIALKSNAISCGNSVFEVDGLNVSRETTVSHKYLSMLQPVAERIDWSANQIQFSGNGIVGLIARLKNA